MEGQLLQFELRPRSHSCRPYSKVRYTVSSHSWHPPVNYFVFTSEMSFSFRRCQIHSLALNSKEEFTEERKIFFGWNPQSSKWSQQTMLLRWTNAMTWYEIASIECSLQIQWQVALKTMTFISFELKMQVNRAENLVLCIWNTSENVFSGVSCSSLTIGDADQKLKY